MEPITLILPTLAVAWAVRRAQPLPQPSAPRLAARQGEVAPAPQVELPTFAARPSYGQRVAANVTVQNTDRLRTIDFRLEGDIVRPDNRVVEGNFFYGNQEIFQGRLGPNQSMNIGFAQIGPTATQEELGVTSLDVIWILTNLTDNVTRVYRSRGAIVPPSAPRGEIRIVDATYRAV